MDAGASLSLIFGALLALFSVFLVGYSLIRRHQLESDDGGSGSPDNSGPALQDIFDAIHTLELEYQLGRMPQEEFEGQFQTYRVQAATVLRDQLEAGRGGPEWVLEQEILLAKDAQESGGGTSVICPDCSGGVPEKAGNCPHCGAEMVSQP